MPLPARYSQPGTGHRENGMHPRIVIARPQRGRGALSAQREEVPLGCNLGKALTARTNHRRPHALPNLTVAAVSDRLVQSHSTAGGHWCTAALPDVSLRGAKRRGNLAVHSWITGRPRRKRNCLPEIAPQGHFLALRAQGATSAYGLLAMTNQGASRHFICATAIPRRPYNITRKLYISDRI